MNVSNHILFYYLDVLRLNISYFTIEIHIYLWYNLDNPEREKTGEEFLEDEN